VQLRQGGLTAADQILLAEKAGEWSEALALYEQALSHERQQPALGFRAAAPPPAALLGDLGARGGAGGEAEGSGWRRDGGGGQGGGLTALQQGHLRCLLQMGHLQSLLRQVRWGGGGLVQP
jgi:hypothetical protein